MARMTHGQREKAVEAIRTLGVKKAGAITAGITIRELNEEIAISAVFRKRIEEAKKEGRETLADNAVAMIELIASGTLPKTDRNVLTANIALANAFEPGFKGVTKHEGKIAHDVNVRTAVPRPEYNKLPPSKISIAESKRKGVSDKDKKALREINRGEIVTIKTKEVVNVEEVVANTIIKEK